jgi:hypothetical protein
MPIMLSWTHSRAALTSFEPRFAAPFAAISSPYLHTLISCRHLQSSHPPEAEDPGSIAQSHHNHRLVLSKISSAVHHRTDLTYRLDGIANER